MKSVKQVLFWSFLVISMGANAYLLLNMNGEKKVKIEVVDVGSDDPEETEYSRGYHTAINQIYTDKDLLRGIINDQDIICAGK